MTTTALDVRRLFNVTQETRFHFNGWFRQRNEVVRQVMAHEADAVFRVTPDEVEAACRSAPRPPPSPDIPEVAEWRPEVSFTVVAHHVVEALGRLPDWSEFREFCASDATTRAMLWTPAQEVVKELPGEARRAMHQRVVADYAAFLADMHVVSVLRAHGFDVRVHPLADVVFKVDAWVERLVLNPRGGGQRSADLLVHAMPPFFFLDLGVTEHEQVGGVALPARAQLDHAARRLDAILHPS
jgi:hypothetical protein